MIVYNPSLPIMLIYGDSRRLIEKPCLKYQFSYVIDPYKKRLFSHLLNLIEALYIYWSNHEISIFRRKADEVQILEETIRARNEQQKKAGVELDATCQICLKTKFADGVGHICHYCSIRCCARCGGKVTLRSNKVRNFLFLSRFVVTNKFKFAP